LYWASLTPRAMFSKSMNSASFRSPFIPTILSSGAQHRPGAETEPDYTARLHPLESFWTRCIVGAMPTLSVRRVGREPA
jgi:hypothetical protein